MLSKLEWPCRRAQLASLIQGYEAGVLPGKPKKLSAKIAINGTAGVLNITASENGKTISFAPKITYPSGKAPLGGWPMVIGYGGGSIPIPAGVSRVGLWMQ